MLLLSLHVLDLCDDGQKSNSLILNLQLIEPKIKKSNIFAISYLFIHQHWRANISMESSAISTEGIIRIVNKNMAHL